MEQTKQTPERNAMNHASGDRDKISDIDRNPGVSEAPQMKVMGSASGSRTTAGSAQEPNTNLSSRPEPSMEVMGNAAGLPPSHAPGANESTNSQWQTAADGAKTGLAMMDDVVDMIRRYPLPSLLIGIGIGYVFSRRSSW
jgi:hypothetical protein